MVSTAQLSHVESQINNQGLPSFLVVYVLEHTFFTVDPHLLLSDTGFHLMPNSSKGVSNAHDYVGKQKRTAIFENAGSNLFANPIRTSFSLFFTLFWGHHPPLECRKHTKIFFLLSLKSCFKRRIINNPLLIIILL